MSSARILYLVLALLGVALPLFHLAGWFGTGGNAPGASLTAWMDRGGGRWSLVITGLALTVFILVEARVRRDLLPLVCIPATFLAGPSLGLPLYLFLRTRKLD